MLPWADTRSFFAAARGRHAEGPARIPTPQPIKLPKLRKWHISPWKKESLMDDLLDGTSDGTSGWDVMNTLLQQAGNIYGTRQGGIVTNPRPGQVVPYGSPVPGTTFGINNTLLLAGVGILGAFLILRKK